MQSIKNNPLIGIKRKCSCCEEYFYISHDNIDDAVYYDKKTYHSSCFINICNQRSKLKGNCIAPKWTRILNNLEQIKQESHEYLSLAVIKENIFYFIRDAYDITVVPTTIWQKLSDIYNGTFKGLIYGIPPEHLLDMWRRKIGMLNGIADKNKVKGIQMTTEQRLSYDLAILVNKYDSYLKWLEKQKILEAENKKDMNPNKNETAISIIHTKAKESSRKQENEDMSVLVDDIFED